MNDQKYVDAMVKQAYEKGRIQGLHERTGRNGKWIPTSRSFPLYPGKYLVTVRSGEVYAKLGGPDGFNCKAIAWMPLPKPYRGKA